MNNPSAIAAKVDPLLEAAAKKLWVKVSFSAQLYTWEEIGDEWRENWREQVRARSVESTDRQKVAR